MFDAAGTRGARPGRGSTLGRSSGIWEWLDALRAAPLFALAMLLYMGLPSSIIFPGGSASMITAWHPAYPGWYDLVFASLAALDLILTRQRVPGGPIVVCIAFLALVVISVVSNTATPVGDNTFSDALLYWLRFSLTFVWAAALTKKNGVEATSQVLFAVGLLLMASAIFVFRLQYPEFNRIYASGVTVGSFGQVLLILFVIAMIRNHVGMMLVCLIFLILTFSRTALLLWLASLGYFLFTRSKIRVGRRVLYGSLILILFASSTLILMHYPEFQFVISERLDMDDIYSMNRRTEVWRYGLDLLDSGSIPPFGVGFNGSPSVLLDFVAVSTDDPSQTLYFPSFHSILFEYAIGLGWLSLPVFSFLLWRIFRTWRTKSNLAFYVYSLFLLSQSFDFSFYRPKEVIIWAAFLGLAEGEILSNQRGFRKRARESLKRQGLATAPRSVAPAA